MSKTPSGSGTRWLVFLLMISYSSFSTKLSEKRGSTTSTSQASRYMENVCSWHGVAPNEAEWKQAMAELDTQYVK